MQRSMAAIIALFILGWINNSTLLAADDEKVCKDFPKVESVMLYPGSAELVRVQKISFEAKKTFQFDVRQPVSAKTIKLLPSNLPEQAFGYTVKAGKCVQRPKENTDQIANLTKEKDQAVKLKEAAEEELKTVTGLLAKLISIRDKFISSVETKAKDTKWLQPPALGKPVVGFSPSDAAGAFDKIWTELTGTTTAWGKLKKQIQGEREKKKDALDTKSKNLNTAMKKLKTAQEKLKKFTGSPIKVLRFTIVSNSSKKLKGIMRFRHETQEAGWKPQYKTTYRKCDTGICATISLVADVSQTTGNDWQNVKAGFAWKKDRTVAGQHLISAAKQKLSIASGVGKTPMVLKDILQVNGEAALVTKPAQEKNVFLAITLKPSAVSRYAVGDVNVYWEKKNKKDEPKRKSTPKQKSEPERKSTPKPMLINDYSQKLPWKIVDKELWIGPVPGFKIHHEVHTNEGADSDGHIPDHFLGASVEIKQSLFQDYDIKIIESVPHIIGPIFRLHLHGELQLATSGPRNSEMYWHKQVREGATLKMDYGYSITISRHTGYAW